MTLRHTDATPTATITATTTAIVMDNDTVNATVIATTTAISMTTINTVATATTAATATVNGTVVNTTNNISVTVTVNFDTTATAGIVALWHWRHFLVCLFVLLLCDCHRRHRDSLLPHALVYSVSRHHIVLPRFHPRVSFPVLRAVLVCLHLAPLALPATRLQKEPTGQSRKADTRDARTEGHLPGV
jgi:hypothetical protein